MGFTGPIESEEGRLEIVKEFAEKVDEEGALVVWVEIVARRD